MARNEVRTGKTPGPAVEAGQAARGSGVTPGHMVTEEIEKLIEAFLNSEAHKDPSMWIKFKYLFLYAAYPVYVAGGGESGYSAYQCVEKAKLVVAKSWYFPEWETWFRKLVDEDGNTVAYERESYMSWRGGGAFRERHILPLRPIECAEREHGAYLDGYIGYGSYVRWEKPQREVVLEPKEKELAELVEFLRRVVSPQRA